jgi:hypothetical protein
MSLRDQPILVTDVKAEGAGAVAAAVRATGAKARALAHDFAIAAGRRSLIADVLARAGRIDGIHTPMREAGVHAEPAAQGEPSHVRHVA